MTILQAKRFLKRKEQPTRIKPIQRTSQTRTIRQSRSLSSSSWQERFQELIQFREQHNHLFVPHQCPENPTLSQWVRKQRHQKKRKDTGLHSTLNAERETLLTNVGFIWNVHEARWQENYRSLTMYRWYHGHCNVPSNYHDTSLANWAKNQRRQYKQLLVRSSRCCSPATTNDVVAARNNKTLDPHRIEMLNSIGFDWNPREHGYNYNNTNNDGK